MINRIESTLRRLHDARPLILCLTNFVTMDFVANCLLAVGASPVMSVDAAEFEELVQMSQAVYINLGTLDKAFISRAHQLVELANRYGKPVILDPVGAGASVLRSQTARDLMVYADIIRGNASEIMSLAGDSRQTRGVDATQSVNHAKDAALFLADLTHAAVVVSGALDFIVRGKQQASLNYGSHLMPLVTGMGCALTAVIAAFRAVESDSFEASLQAAAWFSLCGSLSALKTDRPGSFRATFIDYLYAADFEAIRNIL